MFDYLFYKLREKLNLNAKEEQCEKIIETSVAWSMGAGLLPIPVADLVAVTAVQTDMVRQMAKVYELDLADAGLKTWIGALSGSLLSKLGAEAVKLIPGVGPVIGGISMAIFSGASTYAIGQVFLKHFEEGGNLQNFDTDKFRVFYEAQFEKGKILAKAIQEETEKKGKEFFKEYFGFKKEENPKEENGKEENQKRQGEQKSDGDKKEDAQEEKNAKNTSASDVFEKLKELINMKEKGMISEEEFALLKQSLMKNL